MQRKGKRQRNTGASDPMGTVAIWVYVVKGEEWIINQDFNVWKTGK